MLFNNFLKGSLRHFILSFAFLGTLAVSPTLGAEQLKFISPQFSEFSVKVDDLEAFAKDDRITGTFALYAQLTPPDKLEELKNLLLQNYEVTPSTVEAFIDAPFANTFLERLGHMFKTDTDQNGQIALNAAIKKAATDPQGITVLNLLRQFPSESIRVDYQLSLEAISLVHKRGFLGYILATSSATLDESPKVER